MSERSGDLAELGEDEHFFLLRGNDFGDIAEAPPFSAVVFAPTTVSQPLRGVVANLLEPHQERQYQALSLYSLGIGKLFSQVLHRLLIERGLLAAELAISLDF